MEKTPTGKERLIKSAAQLFHARSYASVGVNDLCEHADVRRGSFYYYFPSKEALALAVLEHEARELTEDVFEPAFGDVGTPLNGFERLLERLHDYHTLRIEQESGSVGGCPIANLAQELGSQYEDIREKAAEIMEGFTTAYERAIADAVAQGELPPDVDLRLTAERVRAYVQGVLEAVKLQNDPGALLRLGIDVRGLAVRAGSDATPLTG